jgi:hypothetical protein
LLQIGKPCHAREGLQSREQLVQQDREYINVAGGRDGIAANLLRACVVGRHQSNVRLRNRECLHQLAFIEKFRDAEVQQLRAASASDENVRGFQVTMHDQVLVRGVNRRAHFAE